MVHGQANQGIEANDVRHLLVLLAEAVVSMEDFGTPSMVKARWERAKGLAETALKRFGDQPDDQARVRPQATEEAAG